MALAAPRIVGLHVGDTAVARYEAVRSSLDLGEREAPVVPYGPVSYVPSAAIICRRSAVLEVGGFDETLHSGEDVDLCWRLVESGSRLRYEPIALVAHEHRTQLRTWLSRKAFYGEFGGAAGDPSSRQHRTAGDSALEPAGLAVAGRRVGTRRSWPACCSPGCTPAGWPRRCANTDATAARCRGPGARGLGYGARQLAAAICRHYWPAALAAAVVSRALQAVLVAAAVIDAVHDWATRKPVPRRDGRPIGPLGYMLLKRLDDLAYGAGLWAGVVRERTLQPLRPDIKR